eukprot:gene8665-biopygen3148
MQRVYLLVHLLQSLRGVAAPDDALPTGKEIQRRKDCNWRGAFQRAVAMAEELDCGDEFLDCEDFDEVASDDEEAQLAAQLLEQL